MILKPSVLTLTGIESGNWIYDGGQLTLHPVNEPADESNQGAVLEQLRRSSPENLRVKKLHVADDFSSLELSDGPMEMVFYPNPEVTQKLKQSGELNGA